MNPASTVADVLAGLERRAPAAGAASWDQVGLQLGDPGETVTSAAVCHEVTAEVVAALEAEPVDLLVTYHPLLFRATTRLVAGPGPVGRAFRLLRARVAVAAVHTNFDVAAGGASDALAAALGLQGVTGFAPVWGPESVKVVTFVPAEAADAVAEAMATAGAGRIGTYSRCSFRAFGEGAFFAPRESEPAAGLQGAFNRVEEARLEMVAPVHLLDRVVAALVAVHPYQAPAFDVLDRKGDAGMLGRVGDLGRQVTLGELGALVSERLGGVVRLAGDRQAAMRRVAVVPGSGGELAAAAAATGAEAFVTGDVSHHRAHAALDAGMAVVDPGHAATERPGLAALYAAVCELAPGARDLRGLGADPWRAL